MELDSKSDVFAQVAGEEIPPEQEPLVNANGLELQSIAKPQSSDKATMVESTGSTNRKFLYAAACAVNLASFTCGVAFGWTSPTLPKLNGLKDPDLNPVNPSATPEEESWIVSLLPIGAALGPFAAGIFADKIGRKKTMLASSVPFVVAFVMFAFVGDVKYFCLGRFLCGLAVGGIFTVLPMYVAEISDDAVRGALASFFQLFIVVGILFSYCVGPYLPIPTFNVVCAVIPCVFIVVFAVFIPECPHYLIAANNEKSAAKALSKFRSKSEDDVQKELSIIKSEIEESMANRASFFDIFKSKGLTKALILSVGLVACQQFSGINIILFYSQTIFAATGSSISPEISTIAIGTVQVIASTVTPFLVDRKGKRFLLMLSGIGMAVSEGILGYYFYLKDGGSSVGAIFWLPVLCLIVYIITYCLGFGPLPWAVMGELFPANIKSAASTVTASGCWVLAFLLTKFFSSVAASIGNAASFWIFTVCCFLATAFVYKWLPETSGKSFQEIQDLLNGVERRNEQTKA